MGYEVLWETGGVVKRIFGQVTEPDLIDSVRKVEDDPRFDDIRFVINDFLAITGVTAQIPTIDEISAIDLAASWTNPRIRVAIVTTSPEITALATYYANSPMNTYPTKLFTSLEDARHWLKS